ncbi:MAG TPA: NADPH:quinone reductase [Tepidisphaeraceae bacterium]|nr:NADPH:quinone reductase [Tepidisphaeraceae bacterium]
MKAIRVQEFGLPEVMKLVEQPDPVPGTLQVVVRIKAIGVNPVETYIRSGTYAIKPSLPYTPGTDAAGVIESVGEEVVRFRPGDRVYTTGTVSGAYAERSLCRVEQCMPLPDNVSFEQGAAIHVPYSTAYRALFHKAKARASQSVFVHGASGGVGIATVQLAVANGITVIGTGGTEEGRKLIKEQGAAHALDHKSPDYLDQLMRLTSGRGPDVIIEMLANVNLGKDMTVLAKNGVIVVVGSRGTVQVNPRDLMRTEGTIIGVLGSRNDDLAEIHAALNAGLRVGSLKPIIGKRIPLAEAALAHHEIIEGTALGKIVLIP